MKNTQRRILFALSLTVIPAMVAGCAGTSDGGADADADALATASDALGDASVAEKLDELYAAAQEGGETSVVVYGPGEQLYGAAYQKFMQRYPGIEVTGEYIYGAELSTRLDQEFSSGQRVGAIQTGGPAMTSAAAKAERCTDYAPFSADDMDGDYPVAEDGTYRAVVGYPFGVAYNTDEISEKEIPQTFTDLADPKFKGRFVLEDPTSTNGTTNTLAQMYTTAKSIDDAWLGSVKANEPMIRANSALTVQAVASGEAAFDPFAQFVMYRQSIADGLPVSFYFPLEGSRIEYHYTCVLADAPNPNATQLFFNWLFTPEAQDALSQTGVYGVRPGTPAPEGLPEFEEATADPIPSVPVLDAGATTKAFVDVSKGIFK